MAVLIRVDASDLARDGVDDAVDVLARLSMYERDTDWFGTEHILFDADAIVAFASAYDVIGQHAAGAIELFLRAVGDEA